MAKSVDTGVGSVIAIVVAIMLVAYLFPPAINQATTADEQFGNYTDTSVLGEGENTTLPNTGAELTVTNVTYTDSSTTANSSEYEINDSGSVGTVTINEGENSTLSVNGVDYDITVNSITEPTAGNYSVDTTVKFQSGGGTASSLWFLVPLFMLIAVIMLFAVYATTGADMGNRL